MGTGHTGGRKKAEVTVYFYIQVDGNRGICVTQFADASTSQRVLSRGGSRTRDSVPSQERQQLPEMGIVAY
jgi:hypothetical protein